MTSIKPLDEVTRERVYEYADAVHRQFRSCVRPIYGAKPGGIPELIGSCVLLRLCGVRYGITAAHVIDQLSESHLYVAGIAGGEPVQILDEVVFTQAPGDRRQDDHRDFAFYRIPENRFRLLGDASCVEVDDVSRNRASFDHRLYMALGYPISKNRGRRRINPRERSIISTSWRYVEGVTPMPKLAAELGISGELHFFQPYSKYSRDSSGKRVSSVSPRGLSGGALVDLGNFASMESYDPRVAAAGHLAGIVIARYPRHGALASIRIQPVIDAIIGRYHRDR